MKIYSNLFSYNIIISYSYNNELVLSLNLENFRVSKSTSIVAN